MGPLIFVAGCERPPEHVPGEVVVVQGAPVGDVSLAEAQRRIDGKKDANLGLLGLDVGDLDDDGLVDVVASDSVVGVRIVLGSGDERSIDLTAASVAVIDGVGDAEPQLAVGLDVPTVYGSSAIAPVVSVFALDGAPTEIATLHTAPPAFSFGQDYVVTLVRGVGDGGRSVLAVYNRDSGDDFEGRAWIFDGPLSGDLELDADADARLVGAGPAEGGGSVLASGDLDGDGVAEMLAALDRHSDGYDVAVVDVPLTGDLRLDPDAYATLIGCGARALSSGDLDGDGRDDVATAGDGEAWVFRGPIDASVGTDAGVAVLRPAPLQRIDTVAIARDLDGDGVDDLLAGAPSDTRTDEAGVVAVWYGPVAGDRELHEADARLLGEERDDDAGRRILGPGDTDGDGFGDVVVGAPGALKDRGSVYLLSGGPLPVP